MLKPWVILFLFWHDRNNGGVLAPVCRQAKNAGGRKAVEEGAVACCNYIGFIIVLGSRPYSSHFTRSRLATVVPMGSAVRHLIPD